MIDTPLSSLGAARAYQSAKRLDVAPAAPVELLKPAEGPSFAELVETTAKAQIQTIRAGEAAQIAGLKGEMPMQQVVEATMAMETALQVTVALRDRVVEAYQEVLRMSV